MATQPWERQPDESPAAFGAFRTYLELGAGRTVVEAYRQATERPEATQASGTWNSWAKAHRWEERARAWDNHAVGVHQKAVERAIAADAKEWANRRTLQHDLEYRVGRRLLEQADRLAQFPVSQTVAAKDGKPVSIEPIEPGALKAAAAIARDGSVLARSAIEAALEEAPKEVPLPDQHAMDRASAELEKWRSEQRRKLMEVPSEPPGE